MVAIPHGVNKKDTLSTTICQNEAQTHYSLKLKVPDKKRAKKTTQKKDYTGVKTNVSVVSSVFSRNLKSILPAGLVLVSCVICLVIHSIIHKEEERLQQMIHENRITEFYVPCDFLSLSVEEDFETFDSSKHEFKLYRDENGTNICSFTNLTHVVEKATERRSRQRVAEGFARPKYLSCGNFSNRPQAGENIAYFTKLTASDNDQTGQRDDILHWNPDPTSSSIGAGISYENGRIRVNSSQLYFVYASVTFNKSSDLQESNGYTQRVFYMTVETATVYKGVEYAVRTLHIAETIKDCPDGVGTAYVGSQMFLEKGNVLYVAVSEARRVVHDATGNTFGLYAT